MHEIQGFVAREDALHRGAASLPGARVLPLFLGFGFLPVAQRLLAEDNPASAHLDKSTLMTLGTWAEEQSLLYPLGYVQTEYFGGTGAQAAIVWSGGRAVLGPICTLTEWKDGNYLSAPLLEEAINQAMRHLALSVA
jgi:hypothetical protein